MLKVFAEAKTYSASGTTAKTFNKDGRARANSASKNVGGTITKRALNRAKKFGNALVRGGRNRGASAPTRPGR